MGLDARIEDQKIQMYIRTVHSWEKVGLQLARTHVEELERAQRYKLKVSG